MAERAALMVDHRLPAVPYRQWVLSFEGPMALRLGYDTDLLGRVCRRFAHRVVAALRRNTRREHGPGKLGPLHPGVVGVVQRFRYDLGLYVHLHALVTDGCFVPILGQRRCPLPAVTGLDVDALAQVLTALHRDLAHDTDEPPAVDDALSACVQLALSGPQPVLTLEQPPPARPVTVSAFGMQLHAASTVYSRPTPPKDGRDRKRLERICRYLLRPPVAHGAIEALADGRVRVHFSCPTRAGACFTTITRDAFLARLAALVPPPRFNMVRYYGVVAGRHRLRPLVQPEAEPLDPQPLQLPLFITHRDTELPAITTSPPADRALSRSGWAALLARAFFIDVTVCPRCEGPMRIVRTVTDPDEIAAALGPRGPPRPRPDPPDQTLLFRCPAVPPTPPEHSTVLSACPPLPPTLALPAAKPRSCRASPPPGQPNEPTCRPKSGSPPSSPPPNHPPRSLPSASPR